MSGPGRQDDDIAGGKFEDLTVMSPELHPRVAARNAERFVNHRVIVGERIDSVAPLPVTPAIGGEQCLDRPLGIAFAAGIDRPFVDEHWQNRVVRDRAVVFEYESEGLRQRHAITTKFGDCGCLEFGWPY